MAVVRSHALSIGIVGLPNSGKSTIFNALTKSAVPAENYPFCTIDKNVGVVKVPEPRLEKIAKVYKSKNIVHAAITFIDIAGLVKGASKGEGLGNQFLGYIRETDAIMYVLRAFKCEKIVHVYRKVDPVEDLEILKSELILKDLETVEKRLSELRGSLKRGACSGLQLEVSTLEKLLTEMNKGKLAIDIDLTEEEKKVVNNLFLLTNKPAFYVLNIISGTNEAEVKLWIEELKGMVSEDERDYIIAVDCKTEAELYVLDENDRRKFIEAIKGYKGVSDIILMAFKRLNLITFFTVNKNEAHAWAVRRGINAKEAAGVVHSDFEKNFVSADVINIDQLIKLGGWSNAKKKGMVRTEGRDYLVRDGDCLYFNASR